MLRAPRPVVPPPPGAGLTKLADPKRALMGWLAFVISVGLVLAVGWPYGVGREVRRLQRELVATGYLRAAEANAHAVPVRRDKALAALNRAVALAPADPIVAQAAAQLYVELRAYAEAAQWLSRRAREAQPPGPGGMPTPDELLTRISLAQSLVMTGRVADGERMLQQAASEVYGARKRNLMPDPLFALMLNNLAYVRCLGKLDLSEALKMVTAAVQLQPGQAAYLDSLGWVEYQLGNYPDAAFHVEQAVRLHLPAESAEMYYHLGAAYARRGQKADARWALKRSLELDPSFLEAADELKTLGQDLPRPALAGRGPVLGRPAAQG
jgi:Tfp pilus assembly protein PilF